MPELPEVETVRRSLEAELVGRTVTRVRVLTRSMVALPGDPPAGFMRSRTGAPPRPMASRLLLGCSTIAATARHGKQLALIANTGTTICIQLGMTGSMQLGSKKAPPHTHVVWTIDDGRVLRFVDPRRFGLVSAYPSPEALRTQRWSSLGPDALTVGSKALSRACAGRTRAIKAVLLDQSLIAGVGNIYADEALFKARVHPGASAGSLCPRELAVIARKIRSTLRGAIKAGGSTIRDYRTPEGAAGGFQHQHLVYGRAAQPCRACNTTLVATQIAQRTTVFCPSCQSP
jgi:formamidopyrimidine-DNA glycosylase